MKKAAVIALMLGLFLNAFGFAEDGQVPYAASTPIEAVVSDPVFGDYGRLLFPVDAGYWSGDTLGDLRLIWYNNIDPNETVEIVNTLHERASSGETVFYDIYTDEEKAADPSKEDTGLFFFKGTPGEKFAICNAGGGFAYRAAMPQFSDAAIDQNRALIDLLSRMAESKDATPAQISLAWMLCKKPWIVPIPGTRKADRMAENAGASEIDLSPDEVRALDDALDGMEMSAVFGVK